MRTTSILTTLLVACPLHLAAAQAPGELQPQPQLQPVRRDVRPEKTLLGAYLLTVAIMGGGGVLGGLAGESGNSAVSAGGGVIGTAALILGPSIGQWYTGHYLTPGLALRVVGFGGAVALAIADPHLDSEATPFGLLGCAGLFASGLVWDVVTLPRSIRRYNREHEVRLVPTTSASGTTGIAFAGRF